MTSHLPPIPPASQQKRGPKSKAGTVTPKSGKAQRVENLKEQGETANIRQNTTNKGYFQGRRVK